MCGYLRNRAEVDVHYRKTHFLAENASPPHYLSNFVPRDRKQDSDSVWMVPKTGVLSFTLVLPLKPKTLAEDTKSSWLGSQ